MVTLFERRFLLDRMLTPALVNRILVTFDQLVLA
jgi:hypothetical protein